MKAVPTPRLDVGEKALAAQLLKCEKLVSAPGSVVRNTHMTKGNRL